MYVPRVNQWHFNVSVHTFSLLTCQFVFTHNMRCWNCKHTQTVSVWDFNTFTFQTKLKFHSFISSRFHMFTHSKFGTFKTIESIRNLDNKRATPQTQNRRTTMQTQRTTQVGVRGSPERGYFVLACVGSERWADFERCSRIHACGFRCVCTKTLNALNKS